MHTIVQTQTAVHLNSITSARPAVSAIDRSRVIRRIAKDHGMEKACASAIFDETIRFLETAAANPGRRFVPTKEVDKGWHTFLLYTKAYRAFCRSIGTGRFIDHEPDDLAEVQPAKPTCFVHCNGKVAELAASDPGDVSCNANNCTAGDCYQGDDD